jgi:hypothetical protein
VADGAAEALASNCDLGLLSLSLDWLHEKRNL